MNIVSIEDKILKFCLYRERSIYEVDQKLIKLGLSSVSDRKKTLKKLVDEKYVNEERFVKAFINDKSKFNKWGTRKIQLELKKKKVDEKLIQKYIELIEPETYESELKQLAIKKWKSQANKEDKKKFANTVRFLANKGYEIDKIFNIVKEISKNG